MKVDGYLKIASVTILPRWLFIGGVVLSVACIALGLAFVVIGLSAIEPGARWGSIGGGLGCAIGGLGALFGTCCDWNRRYVAPQLFACLLQTRPSSLFVVAFPLGLSLLGLGLVLASLGFGRIAWHGGVQAGAIIAFIAGVQEAARRHTLARARALFTLYAEGALDPEDARVIDDARGKSAEFDHAVQAYQRMNEGLRELG